MDDWKIIYSSPKPFEVNLARNFLESEGIETTLQNEIASQLYGNAADKVKLLVREKDVEAATSILIEREYIIP